MLIRLYVRIPYSILEPSTPAFIYFEGYWETLKKTAVSQQDWKLLQTK